MYVPGMKEKTRQPTTENLIPLNIYGDAYFSCITTNQIWLLG